MKIAYVLSGGGAKGAFQVGVLKKLAEQGVKPDVIYGTSVGALNAMGLAYGGVDYLEKKWQSLSCKKWWSVSPSPDILSFNWMLLLFGCADGIFNTKPLRTHLDEIAANQPSCEVVAVRVSVNSGVVDYVSNKTAASKDFIDAVQSSSLIPGIMSPMGEWVDGGVRMVSAVEQAIADGADKVYVILCNPLVQNPLDTYDINAQSSFFKFLNIAYRSVDGVMEHEVFYENNRSCFTNAHTGVSLSIFAPDHILYSTLEFNKQKIQGALDLGYNCQSIDK